jgi:hypothetical protein
MPTNVPAPSVNNLNEIFQVIHNRTNHAIAARMTRRELQTHASLFTPMMVLSCLQQYEGDGLIMCTRNDKKITVVDLNKDYDEFHLTSKGTRMDAPYEADGPNIKLRV